MPWCPRCDETFPQGPACPRCSARLVARDRETYEDALQSVPALKQLKVSRRYARAFDRLSGPRAPSSRALALALVTLVFASGFLLGRVGSLGPSVPTVRALPAVAPIPFDEIEGSIAYATTSRDPLVTIAVQHVFSGDVSLRAQFSPPYEQGEHVTTSVTAFGRSVAVVVGAAGRGHVAVSLNNDAPQGWIQGIEAAWISERELLVRHVDSTATRWTFGTDSVESEAIDDVDALIATGAAPAIRRGEEIERIGSPRRELTLPDAEAKVAAVSPDMTYALLDERVPTLWDGTKRIEMTTGSGEILGARFDGSSERVAIVLRGEEGLLLAIMDLDGNAQLRPLGSGSGCSGPPVWDGASDWIYVSGGNGTIHAVEAGGGRTDSVDTRSAGCGVAWVDTA